MDETVINRLIHEHGLGDSAMKELSDYREPVTLERFTQGFDIVVKRAASQELSREQYEDQVKELYLRAKAAGKYGL